MREACWFQTSKFGVRATKTECTKIKVFTREMSMFHQFRDGVKSPYIRCLRILNDEIESSILCVSCDRSYGFDHRQAPVSLFCNYLRTIDVLHNGPGCNWRKPFNIWLLLTDNDVKTNSNVDRYADLQTC